MHVCRAQSYLALSTPHASREANSSSAPTTVLCSSLISPSVTTTACKRTHKHTHVAASTVCSSYCPRACPSRAKMQVPVCSTMYVCVCSFCAYRWYVYVAYVCRQPLALSPRCDVLRRIELELLLGYVLTSLPTLHTDTRTHAHINKHTGKPRASSCVQNG